MFCSKMLGVNNPQIIRLFFNLYYNTVFNLYYYYYIGYWLYAELHVPTVVLQVASRRRHMECVASPYSRVAALFFENFSVSGVKIDKDTNFSHRIMHMQEQIPLTRYTTVIGFCSTRLSVPFQCLRNIIYSQYRHIN